MLGDNIRRIRLDRHLSQAAFGKILHVSQGAVSQWEQGLTKPDIDQLRALATAFSVSLDELLNDDLIPSFREFSSLSAEPPLTLAEENLVKKYRQLNRTGQSRILMLMDDYLLICGSKE